MDKVVQKAIAKDKRWRAVYIACGLLIVALTLLMGAFLLYQGSQTFLKAHHSVWEFLFTSDWAPLDKTDMFGGKVGAAIYIVGSLETCLLGLLICLPFAIGSAVFMTEISPKIGEKFFRPATEIYVSIPSVVYGWFGLTKLVPIIRNAFHPKMGGFSVLAASIVLAIMIFPTITTVAADAIKSVPNSYREGAYGLGATRWQVIGKVVLPAASGGILTGVVLGLARAIGEALAVAMVIGKTRSFATSLLSPTSNLTSAIAADMGNTAQGGEYNLALWSMALLLFIISIVLIVLIHKLGNGKKEK